MGLRFKCVTRSIQLSTVNRSILIINIVEAIHESAPLLTNVQYFKNVAIYIIQSNKNIATSVGLLNLR